MDDKDLIASATAVRENAYAPFSEFRVGAAVETEDGEVSAQVESAVGHNATLRQLPSDHMGIWR